MAREFNWPVRVYYEDTDVAGVVYYALFKVLRAWPYGMVTFIGLGTGCVD